MQFKLLAIAAAGMLAAALFAITPAQAEPKIGNVYSVLSFDIAGVNYSGGAAKIAPRILYGADMAVGIRALKGVDLEAGFSGLWGHDDVNTAIQGGHLDAIAHVQLVGPVDLLVDGGFTYLDGEISHGTLHAGSRGEAKRPYRTRDQISANFRERMAAHSIGRGLRSLRRALYPGSYKPQRGTRAWLAVATADEIAQYRRDAREKARTAYRSAPIKARLKVKKYKRTHPDVVSAQHAMRQQRIECADDGTLTPSALAHLFAIAHHCPYCSEPLTPLNAVLDHVIPLARGGQHSIRNAVVVCAPCNLSKGPKMPVEFIWHSIASHGSIDPGVQAHQYSVP